MAPNLEEFEQRSSDGVSVTTIAYMSVLFTLLIMSFVIMCIKISYLGQKTRNPQQRRMYVGSRARPSLGQTDPTIFVSPSNFPPPPKYECMAPPSYEEVVGIHYPSYQPQPITQPISTALANAVAHSSAQGNASRSNETNIVPQVPRNNDNTVTETVVTVPDTRTSVTAASS